MGPWLRRAPARLSCVREAGVGERGGGSDRGPGARLVTHRDGARVFQKACVRPSAPARQGAPDTAPCPGPRFSHSPPYFPPQTGCHCIGLSGGKFFHDPFPASTHRSFPSPIHEDLLNALSRRSAPKPGSLAANLGECPRRVCPKDADHSGGWTWCFVGLKGRLLKKTMTLIIRMSRLTESFGVSSEHQRASSSFKSRRRKSNIGLSLGKVPTLLLVLWVAGLLWRQTAVGWQECCTLAYLGL